MLTQAQSAEATIPSEQALNRQRIRGKTTVRKPTVELEADSACSNTAASQGATTSTPKPKKLENWPEVHQQYFKKHGLPYPPPPLADDEHKFSATLTRLPLRQQDIVSMYCSLSLKGEVCEDIVIDASQNMSRLPLAQGGCLVPCICPRSVHVRIQTEVTSASSASPPGPSTRSLRLCRRILPIESLQMQMLPASVLPMAKTFLPSHLQDLAGNAYNGSAFIVAFLCSLLAYKVPNGEFRQRFLARPMGLGPDAVSADPISCADPRAFDDSTIVCDNSYSASDSETDLSDSSV